MIANLFHGKLVKLTAEEPEKLAEAYSRWQWDSELQRLGTTEPASMHSKKGILEYIEKQQKKEEDVRNFFFNIRTLEDDRLIGDVGLDGIRWNHGDAFVGIMIGDREDWNKGYGTDALRIILRYAFTELNLHRLSLNTFEYNPRAIRSYEKAGFKVEGRVRQYLNREGRRWDLIYMGILRDEWNSGNNSG